MGQRPRLVRYIIVYTEQNEAVKSWDNGLVWLSICHYIQSETRPLSHGITAVFGSVYRMKLNRLISINITDEDNGLKIVHIYRQG